MPPAPPGRLEELGAVRRLVALVVEIELRISDRRVGFVEHGRVDAVAQDAVPARVRREQQHRVRRDQLGGRQVGRVARRGRDDRRAGRLLLVEERQRAAAAPAGEHDPLVAEALLRVADRGGQVEHDLLHDQRRIDAAVAAARVDHVVALLCQLGHHRQVGAAADRVHEQEHGVRLELERPQPVGLEEDEALGAAVGVLERRLLGVDDPVGVAGDPVPRAVGAVGSVQGHDTPARAPARARISAVVGTGVSEYS